MKDILRFVIILAAFGCLVWFMDIDNKLNIAIGGGLGISLAFLVFFIVKKIKQKNEKNH
ncbi:MAG TPA: hypothetical protein PKK66_07655 [Bacteroidales bacterium]|nr:hypothetical protein [Bacteroidales bacterium]HPT53167.1 hypothetical protein [Bacteroidales bacterium]